MTKRASSRAEPSLNLAPPPGIKLILASEDLLAEWGTRTERGERITAEWGEPDEHGWYTPMFTVHADDRIGALDAAWATVKAALPEGWKIVMWWHKGRTTMHAVGPNTSDDPHHPSHEEVATHKPTLAAALLALAAALLDYSKG